MTTQAETLNQDQMYLLWDAIEDVLDFVESGEYSLPPIEVFHWKKQPAEALREWSNILNEYMTEETKEAGWKFVNDDGVDWEGDDDDDDEFNEYGLLSDSSCPDPVGFRD